MKNNEIMISVQFDFPNEAIYGEQAGKSSSLSFLVRDDMTLKSFLEGLYYGLGKYKKKEKYKNFESYFILYKKYIMHHTEIIVDFSRKKSFRQIDCTEYLTNRTKTQLTELGFVTSSVLVIALNWKKYTLSEIIGQESGAPSAGKEQETFSVRFVFPEDENYGEYSQKTETDSFSAPKGAPLPVFFHKLESELQKKSASAEEKNPEKYKKCLHLYRQYIQNTELLGELSQLRSLKTADCTEMITGNSKTKALTITADKNLFHVHTMFDVVEKNYILQSEENRLEYNISSRNLETVESSDIEILPPGEPPKMEERSLADVLVPSVLSIGGMIAVRQFMFKSSDMGNTMAMMTAATGVMTLVTTTYNFFKQGRLNRRKRREWKENYQNYIRRIVRQIGDWQKAEVQYLNKLYPDDETLFLRLRELNCDIFARSQNDNDFMLLTLGMSEQVAPLFHIKFEKKDEIFSDVYYRVTYRPFNDKEIKIWKYTPAFLQDYCKAKKQKRIGDKELKYIDGISIELKERTRLRKHFSGKTLNYMLQNRRTEEKAHLLSDLPYEFATRHFRYLNGKNWQKSETQAPYTFNLRNTGAVGFISSSYHEAFVQHIVLNLAYYHSPEDIQFVFFFKRDLPPEEQEQKIRNYKFLPHCNELLEDMSQFVFDKKSAGEMFGQLLNIMNQRVKDSESDGESKSAPDKLTQIVCIIFDDYEIKSSGFSKFLPEAPQEGEAYQNKSGLTFLFLCDNRDKLPRYCSDIIKMDENDNNQFGYVQPRYNVTTRENINKNLKSYPDFRNIYVSKAEDYQKQFELAYRRLSAIYYTRIAENGKVPSMVTLFALYEYSNEDIRARDPDPNNPDESANPLCRTKIADDIDANWHSTDEEYDVTKNLRVSIGSNEHGTVHLDLYEKADGPHMLVAGTTGSGKSETIITYLIGLCMKFSPLDLNLMLVDMKGGGFSDRLGNLPHCVGVVTDTAGESEGISSVYMLKRFLETLNAEIKRRKLLLQEFGIDTADAYMQARRIMEKIDKLLKDCPEYSLKKLIEISHELKASQKPLEELHPDEAKNENISEILDKIGKLNEKQLECLLKKPLSEIKRLSHLVLVVDEFTELKRFSAESDDVDFIAEITTIARVGRTLGFHIILVSQNIEGAITDDIRVNSKARICLKVATRQASKEMINSPAAADPKMPLNGRAYLLVGTGTRFEYFQSAYTGENQNLSLEKPVNITYVPHSGKFDQKFYRSQKDNDAFIEKQKKVDPNAKQLNFIVKTIIALNDGKPVPEQIFLPPLQTVLPLSVEEENWRF